MGLIFGPNITKWRKLRQITLLSHKNIIRSTKLDKLNKVVKHIIMINSLFSIINILQYCFLTRNARSCMIDFVVFDQLPLLLVLVLVLVSPYLESVPVRAEHLLLVLILSCWLIDCKNSRRS